LLELTKMPYGLEPTALLSAKVEAVEFHQANAPNAGRLYGIAKTA
jgi:hypothetical protein